VCTGHGTCSAANSCNCYAGYIGLDCSIAVCNGKIKQIHLFAEVEVHAQLLIVVAVLFPVTVVQTVTCTVAMVYNMIILPLFAAVMVAAFNQTCARAQQTTLVKLALFLCALVSMALLHLYATMVTVLA